ncbi:hypothetical protein KQ51_01368 [Candidatus Izimaplasma bacterium HR1]|jgi:hypothetical protein|nr:hypothetical protein KQ51_01368 [Candidatus Izimaplasma bacterium HR1]
MRKNVLYFIIGLLLSRLGLWMLMSGTDSDYSFVKIATYSIIFICIPLVCWISTLILIIKDRIKFTPLFICSTTYMVIILSFFIVFNMWVNTRMYH